MRTLRPEANYFNDPKKVRSQRARRGSWISSLIATAMIAAIFVMSLGLNPSVALADDSDGFDSSGLESTFNGANKDDFNKYLSDYQKGAEMNSFQYVLGRIFLPKYLNYLPYATVASNAQEQANRIGYNPGGAEYNKYICHTNQVGAGTPIYHNCDVPNFSGEFVQNLYSLFDRSGPQNAFALNAASILFPSFGQSKALPGGSVPADTTGSSNKYTGLEAFGYDLQLSSYYGEWDHIQTITQARLLTNFSFFDSINLTAQSIGNAIGGAFNRAGAMSAQGWNTGGIFGAIGGYFSGLFEGGSSGAMNTLLDTSEANVVLTFGWFRANYANTAYGLRQLTNQEIAAQIRGGFLSYMNATMPQDMTYDEWLQNTDPSGAIMSKPPEPPIANCRVYTTPNGGEVVHGTDADPAPGVTADQCDELQRTANRDYFSSKNAGTWTSGTSYSAQSIVFSGGSYYQANKTITALTGAPGSDSSWTNISGKISGTGASRGFNLGTPDGGDGRGGWDKDGARKAQSFNEWFNRVKGEAGDWDGNVSKYKISLTSGSCSPANADVQEEAAAKAAYTAWIANCWSGPWYSAAEANEIEKQTKMNTTWLTSILTGSTLAKWSASNPGAFDFNSPWKRYVCVNPDGSDVTQGFWDNTYSGGDQGTPKLVAAFDASGNVNAACPQKQYRAPIQGGLFGDGYNGSQPDQSPGKDTRHISNFYGVAIAGIHPFFLQPLNSISQIMFSVGQFSTQISNEIITWTYMPILESLGINEMVTNMITDLRDSIFFPLSVLFVAFAALYVLYQAGVKRRYRDMFVTVLYVALTFILGAALMARGGDVVNFVDRAPANLEKAALSLVLGPAVGQDKICSTNTTVSGGQAQANWNDLDLLAGSPSKELGNIFDSSYSSSDDALREVLCTNWKAFVYYPWAFAQWGTSPENLDASDMQNTNQDLVGNAAVDLGGANGVINNWAVYQLKSMKIGSSTTIDWNLTGVNVKSKDFYRLVDLQAGPNNGAGTDSRYLQSWSGMDPLSRLGTGFMSMVVAILGAVTVGAYSITKIIITVISVLMLIFLPFVFLMGLFPTKRRFVKDYLLTIVSLAAQRIALMLMLAIFLLLLMSILATAQNYMSAFLGSLLMCLAFLKFRKPIVKFAMSAGGVASSGFGNLATKATAWGTGMLGLDGGAAAGRAWNQTGNAANAVAPMDVKNLGQRAAGVVRNAPVAMVASAITGRGVEGTKKWVEGKDLLIQRKQRRAGLGFFDNAIRVKNQLEEEAKSQARADSSMKKSLAQIQAELPEVHDYEQKLKKFEIEKSEFNQAILERKIIEEPALDEYGNQRRDENGKAQFRYQRVDNVRDRESGEIISTFTEITPPQPPAELELGDREFSVKQLGQIRRYGQLQKVREEAVTRKGLIRNEIYTKSQLDPKLFQVGANASDAEIDAMLKNLLPDSQGFTDLSRDALRKSVKEMTTIDKTVAKIDKEMDSLSTQFNRENSLIDYSADPLAAQRSVVESIHESVEENRGGK